MFLKLGYRIVRESGHLILSNGERRLVIPRHDPINAITMGAHGRHREGVLFITLRISEALFSLTTRYRDLALGPSLFHWESHEGSGRWRSAGGWSGRFRRYSYR